MRRRALLVGLAIVGLGIAGGAARAGDFMALATRSLRGDAARFGWSSLRVGFRVQFPAAVSGRTFLSRKYDVLDALERVLERTRYDPSGGVPERERLGRLVADTVRRAAPSGTVSRVSDIWIEAR
ncbi:hypothetical protein [Thalassobaculum sp.]|uniref:hypothetical protein n=1 Tax=Thalassobaculum sp. TaxID=2022740 RepID=UPI0032EFF697